MMTVKDPNCAYCARDEKLDAFGYFVCELASSLVILFREQSHPGRVIVAHKEHVGELIELSDEARNLYFAEVAKVARVIHALYKPDKLNYGAYGDTGHHLHFHLVPKYKDAFEWNSPFAMNPQQKFLSEEEYAAEAEKIRRALAE